MLGPLKRGQAPHDPAGGLLRVEQFQIAYATNDMQRALALFRKNYGIREFRELEDALPQGGHMHACFAWAGSIMYELIHASGPGSEIFMDRVPDGDFALVHHHLGFLIHDEAEWQGLKRRVQQGGFTPAYENNTPGFIRYRFVESPPLDHYLEYLFPEPAGMALFNDVPRN